MTAAAFARIPDRIPADRTGRVRRVLRKVVVCLGLLVATLTATMTFATPANAWPWDDIANDITNFCTPMGAPVPESMNTALEALMDSRVSGASTGTFIGTAKTAPQDYPKPSYSRYGMSGLKWDVYGTEVGCWDLIPRGFNEIPNAIFAQSKFFAGLSMSLIHWTFNDPFGFLNGPIGQISTAVSNIAFQFLGIVGVAGALYLFFKHGAPGARVGAFFRGVVWMGMIAGLFLWFQANPTTLGDDINTWAGDFAATGFQAMHNVSSPGGADASCSQLDTDRNTAVACIQNAFWIPLAYQPWLVGEVGSLGPEADKFGPEALNANYIGGDGKGNNDAAGQQELSDIAKWHQEDKTGDDSQSGFGALRYLDKIPFIKMWAIDICHLDQYGSDHGGQPGLDKCQKLNPVDAGAADVMGGDAQMTRFDAAGMSTLGGLVINATIYFLTFMLLSAKLGVYVLMVFAPLYLMLGMFPGPSRVAAFKLGDMLLANLMRQVGWELAFVIVAYMDTLILKPNTGAAWILQLATCVLFTILLALYARPAIKALTGMAKGDKEAGGAIEGVVSNAAKTTAKTAAFAAIGAASGGISAGMAGMTGMARAKMAMTGAFRAMPKFEGAKDAQRSGKSPVYEQIEYGDSLMQRRQNEFEEARAAGDTGRADRLERDYYEKYQQRVGWYHENDPAAPRKAARNHFNAAGGRVEAAGSHVLAELGLSGPAAAAQQLDRVAAAYGNADRVAPGQGASDALRRYMLAGQVDGLVPDNVRTAAAAAIVANGLPDRIDLVAAPSNFAVNPRAVASALHGGYQDFNQISGDLTAADRMRHLNGIESVARNAPAGTPLAGNLQGLRQAWANPAATKAELQQAYVDAAVSARDGIFGVKSYHEGTVGLNQSAESVARAEADAWLKRPQP